VTTGAISRAKLQSNHHHQQTPTSSFYRPDALPVTQPSQVAWSEGRRPLGAVLHSSDEPHELSQ